MSAHFGNFCDDFFLNAELHTALPLPDSRETVLQFCEAVQKQFPDMFDFYRREGGPYVLEGDRNAGTYRWVELDTQRLSMGAFNPPDSEVACAQHAWILDRSRYYLGMSHLDVESLDVVYGFNLDYTGNRDAVVCEALLGSSPLAAIISEPGARPLNFEPALTVALNEECSLQARLAVETRNSSYQVSTGNYEDEPISVYFTVRAFPRPSQRFDLCESFRRQSQIGEELVERLVIPHIVQPIASAISSAQ